MTFEGHFRCRNHLSTNTLVTYYAPDLRREGALSVDNKTNESYKQHKLLNQQYLLYAVFVSERMQCKSRDLENPSTVHATVSTGQVTM